MGFVYAVLWILTGILLIFHMGKESRVFYPIGGYFLILGVWWAVNTATNLNLFTGMWGWILRGLTVAALILACLQFYFEMRKTRNKNKKD